MTPAPTLTGREKLSGFERFCARIPERQNAIEVQREIEAIARRLAGGINPPRPWSQANGGPY